ncbi:MAG TPA: response regulator [Candidatus Saccharimonadales bacterium]|nr:response regulator [Candidatus Saccharimonadales bacterium]
MKKILIVEDNPVIQQLIIFALDLDGEYSWITADDAVSGITKIIQEKPDLLLLDLVLPGNPRPKELINAFQSCSATPIVIVSAAAEQQTIDECMNEGVKAYITKPFKPTNLLETIRQILQP